MSTQTYTVEGMTCGHCAGSVTREVSRIDGVQNVNVDLGSGSVTVEAAHEISDDAVSAAVDEAGYRVVAAQ